jgi:GT2 family glycosyltransferase
VPRLSVIIVNYNSGDRLGRCLAHLERQTWREFETIVIDNASEDGSEAVVEVRPWVRLIRAETNLGFAAANNRAARLATGEWLVFLNPDAYAEHDWLEQLVAAAARHPSADAFGSTQLMANDPSRIDGAGDVFHICGVAYRGHFGWPAEKLPAEGECFSACAAAAMYRRSVFQRLGGFDERFFCYGEDVDLGFRLRLSGGRAVQACSARVLHEGSGVTGRRSDFSLYYGHRNRIWLSYKNLPDVLFWATAPLRIAFDSMMFIRFALEGRAGTYARAFWDGYVGLPALAGDRRRIQERRSISIAAVANVISWSPFRLAARRALVLRSRHGAP